MTTFTKEQRQAIIAKLNPILREECVDAGWSIDRISEDSYLAAQRSVVSLGKTDNADIFAPTGDEFNCYLRSNYESQGSNVLSTTSFFFKWDISEEEFREKAKAYIRQVDKVINSTKMVRLYLEKNQ